MSILTLLLISAYFTPVTLLAFGLSFIAARAIAPNLMWGWKRVVGALALSVGLTPVPALLWSAISGAPHDGANMFIVGFTSAAAGIFLVGLFCDRKTDPTTQLEAVDVHLPAIAKLPGPSTDADQLGQQCGTCGGKVAQADKYCRGCGIAL